MARRALGVPVAPVAIRRLLLAGIVLAAVAAALGFGWRRRYDAPYPPGQRLFVPAGLLMLPMAIWMAQVRQDHLPENTYGRPRTGAVAMFSLVLALLGGGMNYDYPEGPWLLLLLPAAFTCLAAAIWLASAPRARTVRRRWGACAAALMLAAWAFWVASGAVL